MFHSRHAVLYCGDEGPSCVSLLKDTFSEKPFGLSTCILAILFMLPINSEFALC